MSRKGKPGWPDIRQSKETAQPIYQGLKKAGINFVVTVPDSWLKEVNALIEADPEFKYVTVTREEEGVGVAAGATLGGKAAAITMEATGLGNSITALGGMHLGRHLPLLILASYRAGIGERFSFVSSYCGRMDLMLQALGVPYYILRDVNEAPQLIADCQATAVAQRTPVVVLISGSVLWEEE